MPPRNQESGLSCLLERLSLLDIEGYRFKKALGGGKMSTTTLYEDASRKKVVIKFWFAPTPQQLEEAQREAEALKWLPRWARYHRVFPLRQVDELPVYYLGTSYVEGEPLEVILKNRPPPWPSEEALVLVRRIAEALAPAHSMSFVHADLHPGNIIVSGPEATGHRGSDNYDSQIRVIDYGVAVSRIKALCGESQGLDRFRHFGAVAAWSPEFLQNPQEITPEHDIWAMGSLLYRLVTGDEPFKQAGRTFADLHAAVMQGNWDVDRLANSKVPERIVWLIRCMLVTDPRSRIGVGDFVALCWDYSDGTWEEFTQRFSDVNTQAYYRLFKGDLEGCPHCQRIVHFDGVMCCACGYRCEPYDRIGLRMAMGMDWPLA